MFPYSIQFGGEILFSCRYLPKCIEKTSCLGRAKLIPSCLALCHPMHCSPPRLPCPRDSPCMHTRVGCHPLLQGIFPPRDLSCVSYISCICRQVLYL